MHANEHKQLVGFDYAKATLSNPAVRDRLLASFRFNRYKVDPDVRDALARYNVRAMSPREMADMCVQFYRLGLLSELEHYLLSFQPEVHPEYDATIGRHHTTPGQPDAARDYIAIWTERLARDRKFHSLHAYKSRRILRLLKNIDKLRDVLTVAEASRAATA